MVCIVNLCTRVQVNLKIHTEGSKNQFFLKEYNILKIYSLFLAMSSMPATKRNTAILCAQHSGKEKKV